MVDHNMAASELTLELLYEFFKENGGKVKNIDAVRYFKSYLTDPTHKKENRFKFKTFVNTIAYKVSEGDEKILILKTQYQNTLYPPQSPSYPPPPYSPQADPRNSLGIPVTPPFSPMGMGMQSPPRQPPPYRPPPPPPEYTSSSSLDTMSIGSVTSLNDHGTPQAPPRRRDSDRRRSAPMVDELTTPKKPQEKENQVDGGPAAGEEKLSVKERTQKFNRLASIEDELSPRQPKSAEKKMNNSRVSG
ncbi:unnamed protein product [Acanthoscelides obtectus]|uniref:SOWAHA-C winged helix-turn-helix domain-containing protein n=1 Tax=Acanthoscelides obtectus TaxID=200917 RepID=A0A9P0PHH1_ACAOB|nr:unnamed protein product [Acanthoscelides obtectus]CAK1652643.1 Ankyrin repeat domain-containing protein SOWAHB [Acanthoscelides obtectus]